MREEGVKQLKGGLNNYSRGQGSSAGHTERRCSGDKQKVSMRGEITEVTKVIVESKKDTERMR